MPKSKKKSTKDFQKVRLKVGKKLPKAVNYTETRFKVAQIHVHQKLHQGGVTGTDVEPTTHRKHNYKDLTTQLRHFSSHKRGEGVTGLLELFNSNEQLIVPHLASLFTSLAPLFYDNDSSVRRMCATLFRKIISVPTMTQLYPFIPAMFAHLSCAMTHIDEHIQIDSLLFIDAFIDGPPQLLASGSGTILVNFIELISKHHSSSSRVALVVDPVSKRATQKGRQKILRRLDKFLCAQVSATVDGEPEEKADEVVVDACEPVFYQPVSVVTRLLGRTGGVAAAQRDGSEGTTKVIREYTPKLLDLVYETWMDILPSRPRIHQGVMVQSDTATTLHTITSICRSLFSVQNSTTDRDGAQLKKNDSKTDPTQRLCKAMVDVFPISQVADHSTVEKTKGKAENVTSLHLNLTICEVLCTVAACRRKSSHNASTEHALTLKFVSDVTKSTEDLTIDELTLLIAVCGYLIRANYMEVVGCLESLYQSAHPLSQQKKALLSCLTSLLTDPQYVHCISHRSMQTFVQSLPSALESVAGTTVAMETVVLDGLKVACRRGMINLSQHSQLIIEKMQSVSVENVRALITLLYFSPPLDRGGYRCAADVITNQLLPLETAKYLLHILHYRCSKERGNVTSMSDYLSFAITVLIGQRLDDTTETNQSSDTSRVSTLTSDLLSYYVYHSDISQDICTNLMSLPSLPIAELTLPALLDPVIESSTTSLWSIASAFIALNTFDSQNHIDQQTQTQLLQLAIVTLTSLVSNNSLNSIPADVNSRLFEGVVRFLYDCDKSLTIFLNALHSFVLHDVLRTAYPATCSLHNLLSESTTLTQDEAYDKAYQTVSLVSRLIHCLNTNHTTDYLDASQFHTLLSAILGCCKEIEKESLWSELKYELSIRL